MKTFLAALVAALSLGGCAVVPLYGGYGPGYRAYGPAVYAPFPGYYRYGYYRHW